MLKFILDSEFILHIHISYVQFYDR